MTVFQSNVKPSGSVLPDHVVAARRAEIAAKHRAAHQRDIIAAYHARVAAYQTYLAEQREFEQALRSGQAQLRELEQPLDPYVRVMLENEFVQIITAQRLKVAAEENDRLRQERDGTGFRMIRNNQSDHLLDR